MKKILPLLWLPLLAACNQQAEQVSNLESKIDSLQLRLENSYKPGLGEFMSNIQAHHIKLWFAGVSQNWDLADFEVHEIMESLEDIRSFQSERKESKMVSMLNPPLDSVYESIRHQDPEQFKNSFILMTQTCNSCHKQNDFGFNVVKIPETQPFSNQDFSPQK
jgi:hypothetical protein